MTFATNLSLTREEHLQSSWPSARTRLDLRTQCLVYLRLQVRLWVVHCGQAQAANQALAKLLLDSWTACQLDLATPASLQPGSKGGS